MKKLEDVGVLVARILMPILFITAGWGKITGYCSAAIFFASKRKMLCIRRDFKNA